MRRESRLRVVVAAIAAAVFALPLLAGQNASELPRKGNPDMATLNDLVGQIENAALRERIEEEIRRVSKQKKFGLVFEEHVPECTPLWEIPVKRGALVARKDGKMNDVWRVAKVDGGKALCVRDFNAETQRRGVRGEVEPASAIEFDVHDLVVVAKFGEPIYPYLKPLGVVTNAPASDVWHALIEADNYHALQFLEYACAGKVDCIYIDPPYNTGAKDWKYNNDYVDDNDAYRHSKWLSMMQKRLKLAKKLLNPNDSVLIVTIDEKEYLHLGCLLEEMFPEARIQMVSSVINPKGNRRDNEFSRCEEYLFFIYIGNAAIASIGADMLRNDSYDVDDRGIRWRALLRGASNHGKRTDRPNLFYPLLFDKQTGRFLKCGPVLKLNESRFDYVPPNDSVAMWPLGGKDEELTWNLQPATLMEKYRHHFLSFGKMKDGKRTGYYLSEGMEENFKKGMYKVVGEDDDGAYILEMKDECAKDVRPMTIWNLRSHSASEYGTTLLNGVFQDRRFSFPKSLYAVHDTLRFFVANKPDALIVDFFAGSGTTLHAVNLLNAEDGGRRRCIMVTNNEVSEAEAKALKAKGLKPGDEEWEKLGIARYVTWPRTVCSIEGHDVKGEPLKGNYGVEVDDYSVDEEDTVVSKTTGKPTKAKIYKKTKRQMYPKLAEIKMSDGFKANAAFFKLGFLDKTSVSLGRQFEEMLPTLWMKAGAHGPCPTSEIFATKNAKSAKDYLVLPKNKFAVLMEESAFDAFKTALSRETGIETVYLVTDYAQSYKSMARALKGRTTYQLYRDYIENFRINRGRN
jgi:adenine-specific DNA-methyltransferase